MAAIQNLIVAIDFGTTYSGVVWTYKDREPCVIDRWPQPDNRRSPRVSKVPTLITYDQNGQVLEWGYKAQSAAAPLAWFKLLLDENEHEFYNEYLNSRFVQEFRKNCPKGKTTTSVAIDYLQQLWTYAKSYISRDRGVDFENTYSIQVDLISYKVNQINPLKLSEIVAGDGGMCGSIHLNIAFHDHVAHLVGEDFHNTQKYSQDSIRDMMSQFDMQIKPRFTLEDKSNSNVDLRKVSRMENGTVSNDTIIISHEEMKNIFKPIGDQVEFLVHKQRNAIRKKRDYRNAPIKVVLVGGFGDSDYLFERFRTAFGEQDNMEIFALEGLGQAIAEGAALWGLERSEHRDPLLGSRIQRYSYGVVHRNLSTTSNTGSIPSTDDNAVTWIVKEGETVENTYHWRREFQRTIRKAWWDRGGFDDDIVYQSKGSQQRFITLKTMHWKLLTMVQMCNPINWIGRMQDFSYTLDIKVMESSLRCRPELTGQNREMFEYEIQCPTEWIGG
ncbi:hypothetical protein BDD12DRAFT_891741 [Trichophaea hybrida]|nr:hypothetical protein BDD12DRAFT_891741 [Trichophaea hybrida]